MNIGLALSGGGAKGIAHIGVLKVLEEAQIPVHALAGTSMGGLVAAIYAAGRSPDEIEEIARSIRLLDIIQRNRDGLGLMGVEKVTARLREALGGDLTFEQLNLPLALIAADLETGEEVAIRDGSVVEGMLATMSLPPVFPPLLWRGRLLVDGGVVNPVPFDFVREMGADRVIAVHTRHQLPNLLEPQAPSHGQGAEAIIRLLLYRSPWAQLVHISERSLSIMSRKLVEYRMREAPPDLMIEVLLQGVGLFDLDQVNVCLEAGEAAARRHLPELIALRDTPPPGRLRRWWDELRRRLR